MCKKKHKLIRTPVDLGTTIGFIQNRNSRELDEFPEQAFSDCALDSVIVNLSFFFQNACTSSMRLYYAVKLKFFEDNDSVLTLSLRAVKLLLITRHLLAWPREDL